MEEVKKQSWTLFNRALDNDLIEDLTIICKNACKKLNWDQLSNDSFELSVLNGGFSNRLFTIKVVANNENYKTVAKNHCFGVIRIFNKNMPLTSQEMIGVNNAYTDNLIGTEIFGTFDEGQIEGFLDGSRITDKELRENKGLYLSTAELMSFVHKIAIKKYCMQFDEFNIKLIERFETYLSKIYGIFYDAFYANKYTAANEWTFLLKLGKFASNKMHQFDLSNVQFSELIQCEIKWLLREIKKHEWISDIVFCHNDVHSGNIIHMHEEYRALKLIDYEYSGYNFRCFEFGNYFCELYINNYCEGEKDGFKIDMNNYPSMKYKKEFIGKYFEKLLGSEQFAKLKIESKLNNICHAVKLGELLSHMNWGLWGVLEFKRNDSDWNYSEYGRQRFQEYCRVKSEYIRELQSQQ